jgi:formylglycine-generating enzyme required for sulfatase activity
MTPHCPSKALLEDYVSGRLDGNSHGAVEHHLDACVTCQAVLETLDDLAPNLFAPTSSPEQEPEDLCRLVARAKALTASPVNGSDSPVEERSGGSVLGNYTLLEPIGAGGMGRVFKACHRRMKRVVALKLLAPDLLRSAQARLRFQREVEAVARLSHPNIVAAYDADEAAGRHFLAMEYVEGQTVAELVKREGPLSAERAIDFLLQAARGLEHAHAAGIIHRDVKPANIIVTPHGTVKVLDLGLARVAVDESGGERDLTSTGIVMGTASFMAPEQALDTRQADRRADIYSLGCCLYFMLSGRTPFTGATPMAMLVAHREQPIPSLRAVCPGCPEQLEAFYRKMVAKRPEDRHASMGEVIRDLEAVRDLRDRPARSRNTKRVVAIASGVLAASLVLVVATLWKPANREEGPGATSPSPETTEQPPHPVKPRTPAIEMVAIPTGSFLMGSPEGDSSARADERPQHLVHITHPFLLGRTQVTQAQFMEVMGHNPSAFSDKGIDAPKVTGMDTSQHPVESISWEMAIAFCNALSERHGLQPYYQIDAKGIRVRGGDGYRLPTEAEWEYACRAGSKTRWSFGDDPAQLTRFAWFSGNADGRTHAVGTKAANAWGLCDMHGNVPEWCWDRYDAAYYKDSPDSDPPGSGKGDTRVYRGGSWNLHASQLRSAARHTLGPTYGVLNMVGLRVARNR